MGSLAKTRLNPLLPEVFSLKSANWPEANFNKSGLRKI